MTWSEPMWNYNNGLMADTKHREREKEKKRARKTARELHKYSYISQLGVK